MINIYRITEYKISMYKNLKIKILEYQKLARNLILGECRCSIVCVEFIHRYFLKR